MALANSVTHHAAQASSLVQAVYHLTTSSVLASWVQSATNTLVSTYSISSGPLDAIAPSPKPPWATPCIRAPSLRQMLCASIVLAASCLAHHQLPCALQTSRPLARQSDEHNQQECEPQDCYPIWQFVDSSWWLLIYVEVSTL